MRKFKIAVALIGTSLLVGPALAQDDGTPASLAGVWSLGETASCEAGPAWVFFADGYYAEVQPPDGAPAALGIWRDEGDAIA